MMCPIGTLRPYELTPLYELERSCGLDYLNDSLHPIGTLTTII